MALQSLFPENSWDFVGDGVLLRGFGKEFLAPRVKIKLESELSSGEVLLALVKEIPANGVALILGNDLCGSKVVSPVVTNYPAESDSIGRLEKELPKVFSVCAVTRA